ncbi:hypothetical protein RN001_013238 [Aquatica leii]|uniref:Uncharacterized protein n=1 Tax=Aquatica leii TaxID=1421715 RepID=A0AAN7P2I2_9COLE|nr:hypothetical protein RN001_013238 [Aquatica leii]
MFCGLEAKKNVENKKALKYRNTVHHVETILFKTTLVAHALKRDDLLGRTILARINNVADLVAAEARYHQNCHLEFRKEPETTRHRGKIEDPTLTAAFDSLCQFMENSEECQYSITDLASRFQSYLGNQHEGYSSKWLKLKLQKRYGDNIVITEKPGQMAVASFKDSAHKILHNSWYTEKKEDKCEERRRIVKTAAEIIREDIRILVNNMDEYSPVHHLSVESLRSTIPDSLRCFFDLKRAALEQAVMSACRPRSFLSPLLLSVGLYAHRRFASKHLIQLLSSLGYSSSYSETLKLENSLIASNKQSDDTDKFTQFVFDNADYNVKTIDGLNSFHCMGGIKAPAKAGLVKITMRDVAAVHKLPIRSGFGHKFLLLDHLWLVCHSLGNLGTPSWNGFMQTGFEKCTPYHISSVEALPFIRLDPSNMKKKKVTGKIITSK